MTNPTPHGQVPEALIDLIDAYAETRHRCGGVYNAKTEAARKAVIEALSGVQALSAAPQPSHVAPEAFLKSVIALCSHRGYSPANIEAWDKDDKWIADLWRQAESMLAASPTPLAPQQAAYKAVPGVPLTRDQIREVFMAHGFTVKEGHTDLKQYVYDAAYALLAMGSAPKAAPGEPSYSEKWDAELGRTAMRFVDRAGDVHPGIDDAETICAEFYKAMSEVIERMPHVQRMTPRKAAPGVGNSGFDHQTAADFLSGKTVSDEAVRKFVQASRWAHDEKAALSAMLLSVRGVLASREAEIALLKKALLEAEAAPQQQAPSAAAADTVVLEAALRAIHQAIDLIGEPDTERLRTVRRVLRGAVIVAEDAGEAATAPQPAPAPVSESIDQLARKLEIIGVVGVVDGHDVVRRESVLEIARRAALAAQGGK